MKRHRIWVEILGLATLIACMLALLLATLGAVAGTAVSGLEPQPTKQAAKERTFEGMVTCSRCGAKHSASLAKAADACVRVCVHDGGSFALVESDTTYLLDGDMIALKKVAGQRARIVGTLSGKTIKVSSVATETYS
jgi:hypothetical protein